MSDEEAASRAFSECEAEKRSRREVIMAFVIMFLSLAAVVIGEEAVTVNVYPKISLWQHGDQLRVRIKIPRDERNRKVIVKWIPSTPYGEEGSTYIQLEGAESAKYHEIIVRRTVPAEWTIMACLYRSDATEQCSENIAYMQ